MIIDVWNDENSIGYIKDLRLNKTYKPGIVSCNNLVFSMDDKYVYYCKKDENLRPYAVYWHLITERSSLKDELLFEETDEKYFVDLCVSKDKQYFIVKCSAKESFKIFIKKREQIEWDDRFICISKEIDNIYSIEFNNDNVFLIRKHQGTNLILKINKKKFDLFCE